MFRRSWSSPSPLPRGVVAIFTTLLVLTACGPTTTSQNPIQTENVRASTTSWGILHLSTTGHRIEGYADQTSVDAGGRIGLYVNVDPPSPYSVDVFRMGWYGGLGARQIVRVANLSGTTQPACPMDAARGTVSCTWARSYSLAVPTDWASGVYLARLTRSDGYQRYIVFVVRNDAGTSALLFQTSVLTYQAYNDWGGRSLYGGNPGTTEGGAAIRAYAVSFDRPYSRGFGAGDFFFWEYPMLRWLEANGYDVSYETDVDTALAPDLLLHHKAILSVGHDEYWTRSMRDNVEYARDHGVSLGFFGGNIAFWQARLESSATGSQRIMVCYKDKTLDPAYGQSNDLVTVKWRDPLINRPEQTLIGQMWESWFHPPTSFALKPINTQSWPYVGTGVHDGDSIANMVGYEYDRVFTDVPTPSGLVILASSPVVNVNGTASVSNVTLYTAPSGARVFSAGSIQWSWGLDDQGLHTGIDVWSTHHTATDAVRRLTSNILDNFINGH
jgi:hypothetical protein